MFFFCIMAPYARGVFNWGLAMWCHVFNKVSKIKDASFFEAVHSFAYHHVDLSLSSGCRGTVWWALEIREKWFLIPRVMY